MKKNLAFTLAEVLITLTIIGVIAALTIPNLMQSYRKHQVEVGVKEAYSILSNAIKMSEAENGTSSDWTWLDGYDFGEKYIIPYLKVEKQCGDKNHKLNTGCFNDNTSNGKWYFLDNTVTTYGGYTPDYYSTAILSNGMHIAIWATGKPVQEHHSQYYVRFLVDINGNQGSSTIGKDIFSFYFNAQSSKLSTGSTAQKGNSQELTYNASYNTKEALLNNDCNLSGTGYTCTRVIELNSWKIPDDYPVKKW